MRLRLVLALAAVLTLAMFFARSPERGAEQDAGSAVANLQPKLDSLSRLQTSARLDSAGRIADSGGPDDVNNQPSQSRGDGQAAQVAHVPDRSATPSRGERVVYRRACVVAKAPRSTFSIRLGKETDVRPKQMVWRNPDDGVAVVPHLKRTDEPDLTSVDAMVASVLQPGMTDEERATAIWALLSERLDYHPPNDGGGEFHDPVKLVNVYGYGICDDFAAAFVELCRRAGYRARTYELGGHVVGEVYYDDDWHMFDPSFQVFYRRTELPTATAAAEQSSNPAANRDHRLRSKASDGEIADVRFVEEHPELVMACVPGRGSYSPEQLSAIYRSSENNKPYELPETVGFRHETTIAPVLEPGDTVVFDWEESGRVHRSRAYPDGPDPPRIANGLHTRVVNIDDLEWRRKVRYGEFDWPFVVLGAEIRVLQVAADNRVSLSVSNHTDGVDWDPIECRIEGTALLASADAWLAEQTIVPYGYLYRLEAADGSDPARSAERVLLRTAFQFAPRNRPHVRAGDNEFSLKLEFLERRPRSDWQGLEIQLIWQEAFNSDQHTHGVK